MTQETRRFDYLAILAMMLFGLLVRYRCASGDLWLDEIWSWDLARQASSALEVFTKIRHDNNHFFNTLLIHWMGTDWDPLYYRVPAVVAGMFTIPAAAMLSWNSNRPVALITAALTTFSFLAVHYSSEARGYAFLILFATLTQVLFEQLSRKPNWTLALVAGIVGSLSFLSHLTFLFLLAAIVSKQISVWIRDGRRTPREMAIWSLACGIPVATLTTLYFVNLSDVVVGGGNSRSLLQTIVEFLACCLGGVAVGSFAIPGCVFIVALSAHGIWYRATQNRHELVFYGTLLSTPIVMLAVRSLDFMYLRYFLILVDPTDSRDCHFDRLVALSGTCVGVRAATMNLRPDSNRMDVAKYIKDDSRLFVGIDFYGEQRVNFPFGSVGTRTIHSGGRTDTHGIRRRDHHDWERPRFQKPNRSVLPLHTFAGSPARSLFDAGGVAPKGTAVVDHAQF